MTNYTDISKELQKILDIIDLHSKILMNLNAKVNKLVGLVEEKPKIINKQAFRLVYVDGMPKMRITNLKNFIASISEIDRELLANVGYAGENLVEIIISSSAIDQFISKLKIYPGLEIQPSKVFVMSDKTGVIKRLKRVDSERIRNYEIKKFYKELTDCLISENNTNIDEFLIDEFMDFN